MVPIGKDYIYIDGHIYREIKPCGSRWKIVNKQGKRQWITMKQILDIIDKRTQKML